MSQNDSDEISLTIWKPEAYVEQIDLSLNLTEKIILNNYSEEDFIILKTEFDYFFKLFGIEVSNLVLNPAQSIPKASNLTFYFEKNGINCLVIPLKTTKTLEKIFFEEEVSYSSELLEYLARKFIFLLSRSKIFKDARFTSHSNTKTSFPFTLKIEFLLNYNLVEVYLLLNSSFGASYLKTATDPTGDELSVNLCFLMVPVNEIEEYLNSESVIDLEVPITSRAYLKLEKDSAITGVLGIAEGKWVFKPTSKEVFRISNTQGKALLQIELFKVRVPDLQKSLEKGEPLFSNEPVTPSCKIKVGADYLATGKIYVYDQRLALVVD